MYITLKELADIAHGGSTTRKMKVYKEFFEDVIFEGVVWDVPYKLLDYTVEDIFAHGDVLVVGVRE